ncbi:hypothetical protein XENTR_v10011144 [Xenopus tropicalis]|nr:hypothetical protein XENTR_v10011144 [Xenopus tropicalis]
MTAPLGNVPGGLSSGSCEPIARRTLQEAADAIALRLLLPASSLSPSAGPTEEGGDRSSGTGKEFFFSCIYTHLHTFIHTLTAHILAFFYFLFFFYFFTLLYTYLHSYTHLHTITQLLHMYTHVYTNTLVFFCFAFFFFFFSFYHFVFIFFYLKTVYFDSVTIGSDILATNYTVM